MTSAHLPLRGSFGSSILLALLVTVAASMRGAEAAHQATGIKISEPTPDSVVIWTRVSRSAEPVPADGPLPTTRLFNRTTGAPIAFKDNATYVNARAEVTYPPGVDLSSIRGAAAGAPGETRVRYRVAGGGEWSETPWRAVDPQRDFVAHLPLTGLKPATRYEIEVAARPAPGAAPTSVVAGGFTTAPDSAAPRPVSFCVMTCQQYEDQDRPGGFAIYPSMLALRPDFCVNTGDAVYYDHGPVHAVNAGLARYHWARMFSLPTLRDFHRQVGSYFMKDDHDVLTNDSEPGWKSADLSFEEGLRIFHEQTALTDARYRTVRWGRHLQVWMVEGRDFRTTRVKGDTTPPTIWGAPQMAWLERTLAESDATFRVLITSTPIVGPDRPQKDDNYSNPGFAEEGARVRQMLGRFANLTVITGDRHWQYVSRDPATGLEEWSVGAASDAHAGGWSEDKPRPMHRFLRIKHGGFLSGAVQPAAAGATFTLKLHDVDGRVVFSSERPAGR
jgi:alkaline phosphatase D